MAVLVPVLHYPVVMAQPTDRIPRTYDEITRRTVPELDSSFRPSREQERAAYKRARILSADEHVLHTSVASALASAGLDVSAITIEIDGTSVTLRGRVGDADVLRRLEDCVRSVEAVGDIVDLVVVDAGA